MRVINENTFPQEEQVKQILMDSGLSSNANVILGGDPSNQDKFSNISTSGKMANLYNALIMADKMARKWN